uniref:Uncharacterized protein n=1 Tax=Glossina pallidipes TaxID=7398 RepID=A0A1B0A5M5_GLOPL
MKPADVSLYGADDEDNDDVEEEQPQIKVESRSEKSLSSSSSSDSSTEEGQFSKSQIKPPSSTAKSEGFKGRSNDLKKSKKDSPCSEQLYGDYGSEE